MANNQAALAELRELVPTKPQERFPEMEIPPLRKLGEDERIEVKFYREMQEIFQASPFHITTEAERARNTDGDDIERFGDRYKPKVKVVQSLADVHANLQCFPEELHSVLQHAGGPRKKRKQEKIDILRYIDMTVEAEEEGADDEVASEKDDEDEEAEDEDKEFSEDGGNDYEQEYFSDGAEDHDDIGDGEEVY
ncbi:DNA-directed RNA polymerase III, subunit Rpc31 [Protomyces lactucae-debilis]|uniref:DNA-directed RNA polymerase III subunit n=1 Tax=Protomyces lactucae-debilis TaxID=2754530 RepID=A0A1Y2FDN0_PROLT|nr:DNA-directed RNA polymerase III, subunit Rpc31 [Protomyces lactucae-debilis]ORY81426.1 DNA-directed RNA polymerase III, subunit Rpc31 [Protomyces lactucae-debilis]